METIEIGKGIIGIEFQTDKIPRDMEKIRSTVSSNLDKTKNEAIDKAEKIKTKFSDIFKSASTLYTTLFASAAIMITKKLISSWDELIEKVRNYADEIDKMSMKMQLTTDEFQQWQYIAKLSGVEMSSLQIAMKTVADVMEQYAKGNQEATRTLGNLGISVKNSTGEFKSTTEIIMQVADRISVMTDKTERMQVATNLFGRSALELMPILEQGSAGIAKMSEEAKNLGLVVSQDVIDGFVKAKDEIATMELKLNALRMETVAGGFSFKEFVTILKIDFYETLNKIRKAFEGLNEKTKMLILQAIQGMSILTPFLNILAQFQSRRKEILSTEKEIAKEREDGIKVVNIAMLKQQLAMQEMTEEEKKMLRNSLDMWKDFLKQFDAEQAAEEERIKKRIEELKDIIEKNRKILEKKPEPEEWEPETDWTEKQTENMEKLNEQMDEYIEAQFQVIKNDKEIKISKEDQAKIDAYNLQQEINKWRQRSETAIQVGEVFANLYEVSGENSQAFLKAQQAMTIIQMMFDGYAMIAKAGAQGGIYGLIAGAIAFTRILAYIQKVKSMSIPEKPKVKYPKMAEGGIVTKNMIVEVAEKNKAEAIFPLEKLENYIEKNQEMTIKIKVDDKSDFLRSLAFEIEKIKRKEYV